MSTDYIDIFLGAYESTARYLWKTVANPFPPDRINGFYFLIFISLLVWGLEIILPWRKKQAIFRKDFWQDSFYMFFNFYLFGLLIYAALSGVSVQLFTDLLSPLGYEGGHLIDFSDLPWGWELLIFFFIADFVQWLVHITLHRVPFLWKFHKVHHSVKEMGFAAHLRYHFFETFIYQSFKYISLVMIFGFSLENAFIVYSLTVLIGHLNHANLNISYGPFKYLLNNPKMHIWHHAKQLPTSHKYGMNFGISLSCWDYIFGTNYIPSDGRDIELGFPDDEKYPESFIGQVIEPFKSKK
ncbi:MAG: sterol desaturase family protein [Crocinitomicaceae bacterium]|nr:sterol desaturase family protein [Crocinitomicaceae bacterium]MDG2440729.1 sterol desaturase family protein [Crocinitomicaceae bacterium]